MKAKHCAPVSMIKTTLMISFTIRQTVIVYDRSRKGSSHRTFRKVIQVAREQIRTQSWIKLHNKRKKTITDTDFKLNKCQKAKSNCAMDPLIKLV